MCVHNEKQWPAHWETVAEEPCGPCGPCGSALCHIGALAMVSLLLPSHTQEKQRTRESKWLIKDYLEMWLSMDLNLCL